MNLVGMKNQMESLAAVAGDADGEHQTKESQGTGGEDRPARSSESDNSRGQRRPARSGGRRGEARRGSDGEGRRREAFSRVGSRRKMTKKA